MNKKTSCIGILLALFLITVVLGILSRILFRDSIIPLLFMLVFASLAFGFALVLFGALFIQFISSRNKARYESNRSKLLKSLPEKREVVKVVSKASDVSKAFGRDAEVRTTHYISFLFRDGSRKNFVVDINTYNTLMENDTGELIYKQNGNDLYFLSFLPHP